MDVMDSIFRGRVYPAEQISDKVMAENAEYKKLVDELADRMDGYKASLSQEYYAKLDGVANLMSDIHSIELVESFKYGLSLGLHLMQEAEKIPGLGPVL